MRIFVAIDIPDDICQHICDLTKNLKAEMENRSRSPAQGLRWSRPEGLHITLKFLGEVPPATVEQVKTSLASVHLDSDIPLRIQGSGYFPTEAAPRLVWLGVAAGAQLRELANLVERTLEPLGFAREKRPFSPHLTIARVGRSDGIGDLKELLRSQHPPDLGSFTAKEFFLYQSTPSAAGSVYTKISRFSIDDR